MGQPLSFSNEQRKVAVPFLYRLIGAPMNFAFELSENPPPYHSLFLLTTADVLRPVFCKLIAAIASLAWHRDNDANSSWFN